MPEAAAAAQRERIEPRQQPGGRLLGRDAGEFTMRPAMFGALLLRR